MTDQNQRIKTGIITNFMGIKVPATPKRTEARAEILRTMSLATVIMPHLCQASRNEIGRAAKQKLHEIYLNDDGLAKSKLADQDVYKRFHESLATDAPMFDIDDPAAILGPRILHAPTPALHSNGVDHSDKAVAAAG